MKLFVTSLFLALILLAPANSQSAAKNRVIIFGFSAPFIDDIQERVFREELMRLLLKNKITPMPVMDIEYLVNEKLLSIRSISIERMSELALENETPFAVKGDIIQSKYGYTVTLTVFEHKNNRVFSKTIAIKSAGAFAEVYKDIAGRCAGELYIILQ